MSCHSLVTACGGCGTTGEGKVGLREGGAECVGEAAENSTLARISQAITPALGGGRSVKREMLCLPTYLTSDNPCLGRGPQCEIFTTVLRRCGFFGQDKGQADRGRDMQTWLQRTAQGTLSFSL